jgi:CBS domain-containing protein
MLPGPGVGDASQARSSRFLLLNGSLAFVGGEKRDVQAKLRPALVGWLVVAPRRSRMRIGPLVRGSVVSAGPQHAVAEAARRMANAKVGSAIVLTEEGHPGIITERDVLRAVADGVDLEKTPIADYMTANAITASPTWDVVEAARTMSQGGFRHLIVLNDQGDVEGMLSLRDLVDALLQSGAPTT